MTCLRSSASVWAALLVAVPFPALAAPGLDGAELGLAWGLPFAGVLAAVALGPTLLRHAWERHQGKIAAAITLAAVVPMVLVGGAEAALSDMLHALLLDYVPFILVLVALYAAAGGIVVTGNLRDSPGVNTALLAAGTLLASLIGTTGASMVLIRPLLRANDDRRYGAHVAVFFIFLVSNIGGALSPLGDPPLFIGFLRGIDFFWPLAHLWRPTLLVAAVLLGIFYGLDHHLHRLGVRRDLAEGVLRAEPTPVSPIGLRGLPNIGLIGCVIAVILAGAAWHPDIALSIAGVPLELSGLARDGALALLAVVAWAITPAADRRENGFSWAPMSEVAKLFAAIFLCVVPVLKMLQAGPAGAFAPLFRLIDPQRPQADAVYFWITGALSAVLDNAPTYLVFFQAAGADPQHLMGQGARTLAAISCGAVFMGALTYVGNAPNFMVYAIARSRGVAMPGFIAYLAWSVAILVPVFALTTLVFFL